MLVTGRTRTRSYTWLIKHTVSFSREHTQRMLNYFCSESRRLTCIRYLRLLCKMAYVSWGLHVLGRYLREEGRGFWKFHAR